MQRLRLSCSRQRSRLTVQYCFGTVSPELVVVSCRIRVPSPPANTRAQQSGRVVELCGTSRASLGFRFNAPSCTRLPGPAKMTL